LIPDDLTQRNPRWAAAVQSGARPARGVALICPLAYCSVGDDRDSGRVLLVLLDGVLSRLSARELSCSIMLCRSTYIDRKEILLRSKIFFMD
jgi:hypothetical protein